MESPADIKEPFYQIEEFPRMGFIVLTLYRESHPIGSLTLDPSLLEDQIIINEFKKEFLARISKRRDEEIEKRRVDKNARNRPKNPTSLAEK